MSIGKCSECGNALIFDKDSREYMCLCCEGESTIKRLKKRIELLRKRLDNLTRLGQDALTASTYNLFPQGFCREVIGGSTLNATDFCILGQLSRLHIFLIIRSFFSFFWDKEVLWLSLSPLF